MSKCLIQKRCVTHEDAFLNDKHSRDESACSCNVHCENVAVFIKIDGNRRLSNCSVFPLTQMLDFVHCSCSFPYCPCGKRDDFSALTLIECAEP